MLYEQIGELTIDDMDKVEIIRNLADEDEWSAIGVLYGTHTEMQSVHDMLLSMFGVGIEELNELAEEFGFSKVENAMFIPKKT